MCFGGICCDWPEWLHTVENCSISLVLKELNQYLIVAVCSEQLIQNHMLQCTCTTYMHVSYLCCIFNPGSPSSLFATLSWQVTCGSNHSQYIVCLSSLFILVFAVMPYLHAQVYLYKANPHNTHHELNTLSAKILRYMCIYSYCNNGMPVLCRTFRDTATLF